MRAPRCTHLTRRAAVSAFLVVMLLVGCANSGAAADEAAAPKFVCAWGQRGTGPAEFDFPIGIAIDTRGEIVVTDFYNARVQRFDSEGRHRASFAVLPNPGGLALNVEGNLYLTHFSAMKQNEEKKPDRVSVYSAEGKLLRQWGKTGTGDGEFDYPGGLAVSPDGKVYVADQTNRRVQVFDRDGKFLFKWGEYGTKPGQFGGNVSAKSRVGGPNFLALDQQGNVFTTEGSVGRVQQFTSSGKFLAAWGDNEDRPGSFGGAWGGGNKGLRGPVGICFDATGRLWISAVSGRIQRFTTSGRYEVGVGGETGTEPGQFQAPHGVAADSRGNLYVVDSYNHRVQKFATAP